MSRKCPHGNDPIDCGAGCGRAFDRMSTLDHKQGVTPAEGRELRDLEQWWQETMDYS